MYINTDDVIRDAVCSHLSIGARWIGEYNTSTFGVNIDLMWNGMPISSTIVNFIDANEQAKS